MPSPPSLWLLFRVWLGLGLQSFGGGAATLYLIRRSAVERYGWLSADEFTRDWGICQVAPGINLLGLTILIGWRIARARGAALALAGLLLPSVTITIVITAFYAQLQSFAVVRDAVRGIIPATVGLGLLLAVQLQRPLLRDSRREGRWQLAAAVALILASMAVTTWMRISVVWILWGAGALGALVFSLLRRRSRAS